MRLHAVLLSDDDGGRAVRITPEQIAQWVDYANRVYAFVRVQLDFDPSSDRDISRMRNTALNSLDCGEDREAPPEVIAEANEVAARYPGEVTVLFRYGPYPAPTGRGCGSTADNFILAPGFNDTHVCGNQKIELLAHELGHYLGLAHTHPEVFRSVREAEEYFEEHGRDPLAFDGDGIPDTPPDPFVRITQIQCTPVESLRLLGVEFPLPRDNLMSYYGDRIESMVLTPIQGDITRQGFLIRAGRPLSEVLGGEGPPVFEAEELPYTRTRGRIIPQEMRGFWGLWSGERQLFWRDGRPGDRLTLHFRVASAGRYDVYLRPTYAPDYGIFRHRVDGNPAGGPLDLYARVVRLGELVHLGTFQLEAGNHTLTVEIRGANSRAIGGRYFYGLDYILLKRSGD